MNTKLADGAIAKTAALALRAPRPPRGLAEPPSGSGLLAVPGEPGPPLIGYSLNVYNDLLALQRELYDRHGPIYWTNAFGTSLVLCNSPEAISEVLVNRGKTFANGWEPFLGKFFPRGLMLLDFEEHLHHRRIMQEAFARDRLVSYLEVMNQTTDRAMDSWMPSQDFQMYPTGKQLTLDIASRVFTDTPIGEESRSLQAAFNAGVEAGLALFRADVPGGKWHRGLRGRRQLEQDLRARITERRESPGPDMLSVLIHAADEEGNKFSDQDVINHMIFLLMAAHDTSTTTLAMMTYYLGRHPEWQEQVRQESLALGRSSLEYTDLDSLESLDLVMKESLRLCAPVGVLARTAVTDTEVQGHFIPKGTTVGLSLSSMHRMEPWWPNPDEFDPERFDAGRRGEHDRSSFIPFGSGVHKCIGMYFGGMEIKTILHHMVRRFEWSIADGYQPSMGFGTGPFPKDGLPIRLTARTEEPA